MRKAKIMLMAIAVLGIVGGALAFKTTSKFQVSNTFCYTTTLNNLPFTSCVLSMVTSVNNGQKTTPGIIMSTVTAVEGSCAFFTTVGGLPKTYYCTIPLFTNPFINSGGEQ